MLPRFGTGEAAAESREEIREEAHNLHEQLGELSRERPDGDAEDPLGSGVGSRGSVFPPPRSYHEVWRAPAGRQSQTLARDPWMFLFSSHFDWHGIQHLRIPSIHSLQKSVKFGKKSIKNPVIISGNQERYNVFHFGDGRSAKEFNCRA